MKLFNRDIRDKFMQISDKLVIIVMGPPGSGKGTQAELLAEKFNLEHLETAGVIEPIVMSAKKDEFIKAKGKKYFLFNQKRNWLTGKLWDPLFTAYFMKKKIKEVFKAGKGLILSGSPRTLAEGREEIPLLKRLYGSKNIKIILLEITPEETIFRNTHRRICQLMRHPIVYMKETKNLKICPLDGSKLLKRGKLDKPETIKIRLKEYKERTSPLIDYFKKEGLRVKKVNGSPPPADVFKNILKVLKY